MWFFSTVWYGIMIQASLFNSYLNSPCTMLIWDFIYFWAIISFRIKEKHYSTSLLISNIENTWLMIKLCLFWCPLAIVKLTKKSVHQHQPQSLHKDINLGPVNLSTIKTMSFEKVIFAFHHNNIDLPVVIPSLAHSY